MPWDARDTMSLRTEFVLFASQDGANIRSLCRRFGISPATGYKWLRRWAQEGAAGLQDRPRIPHHSPNRLWQMDFKGHFLFGGGRCHPLTVGRHHRHLDGAGYGGTGLAVSAVSAAVQRQHNAPGI